MAIFKALKGGRSLGAAIRYAAKEGHTLGKDCADDPTRALDEMNAVKMSWDQTEGRSHKHYVLSFAKDEIDIKGALEIAEKLTAQAFPGHQVFLGGHECTGKNHIHIVVNSVNLETGQKLHLDDNDLDRFKDIGDGLCKEAGLSVIDRTKAREQNQKRIYNMAEYQLDKKGKSHARTLELNIADALNASAGKGRAEFIEQLKRRNISVDFERSKNDVSFCDESVPPSKTGKRKNSRGSKLAEKTGNEMFTRAALELALEIKIEETKGIDRDERRDQTRDREDDRRVEAELPPDRRNDLQMLSEVGLAADRRFASDVILSRAALDDLQQHQHFKVTDAQELHVSINEQRKFVTENGSTITVLSHADSIAQIERIDVLVKDLIDQADVERKEAVRSVSNLDKDIEKIDAEIKAIKSQYKEKAADEYFNEKYKLQVDELTKKLAKINFEIVEHSANAPSAFNIFAHKKYNERADLLDSERKKVNEKLKTVDKHKSIDKTRALGKDPGSCEIIKDRVGIAIRIDAMISKSSAQNERMTELAKARAVNVFARDYHREVVVSTQRAIKALSKTDKEKLVKAPLIKKDKQQARKPQSQREKDQEMSQDKHKINNTVSNFDAGGGSAAAREAIEKKAKDSQNTAVALSARVPEGHSIDWGMLTEEQIETVVKKIELESERELGFHF